MSEGPGRDPATVPDVWIRVRIAMLIGAVVAAGAACGQDSTASMPGAMVVPVQDASASKMATTTPVPVTTAAQSPALQSPAPQVAETLAPVSVTSRAAPTTIAQTSTPGAIARGGVTCGAVRGPEGALRVVIFGAGSAQCALVMPVAEQFAPSIAAARTVTIDGWECGPSQTIGVLARCSKDTANFGFVVE